MEGVAFEERAAQQRIGGAAEKRGALGCGLRLASFLLVASIKMVHKQTQRHFYQKMFDLLKRNLDCGAHRETPLRKT
jgi:hypothetical protein